MENETFLASVPNVYFDEDAEYFKINVPQEEAEKMEMQYGERDASDFFIKIFLLMEQANYENKAEQCLPFANYLDRLNIDSLSYELFDGRFYQLLPDGFSLDKLASNIDDFVLGQTEYFFYGTYYDYATSHGQTPEQFFAVFEKIKEKNDAEAREKLEYDLQRQRERSQRMR